MKDPASLFSSSPPSFNSQFVDDQSEKGIRSISATFPRKKVVKSWGRTQLCGTQQSVDDPESHRQIENRNPPAKRDEARVTKKKGLTDRPPSFLPSLSILMEDRQLLTPSLPSIARRGSTVAPRLSDNLIIRQPRLYGK